MSKEKIKESRWGKRILGFTAGFAPPVISLAFLIGYNPSREQTENVVNEFAGVRQEKPKLEARLTSERLDEIRRQAGYVDGVEASVNSVVDVEPRASGPEPVRVEKKVQDTKKPVSNKPYDKYDPIIDKYSELRKLNRNKVEAQIKAESAYDAKARGSSGEIGLAQIMPATGAQYGFSEADLWIPEKNIDCQTRILRSLLDRKDINGNYELAFASYNAGYGNILHCLNIINAANSGKDTYTIKRKGKRREVNIIGFRGLNPDWEGVRQVLPSVTGKHARTTIGYVEKIIGFSAEM